MEAVYRECPICNSKDIKNLKRISFNMDGIMPNYYFLSKCNNCGFVYANTPATVEEYDKYYVQNNRYSSLTTQDDSSEKIYKTVYSLMEKYVKKYDKVIDVGCATGGLLRCMKSSGYKNLTGLDPSQDSIDKLNEVGLFGIKASIYSKPPRDVCGQFDVVIVSFVFEHLFDLHNTMGNLKSFLKPGGKILCFVPNSLEYYLYPSPLPHYINIEHINHFSPSTLQRLFEENGFSMLECNSTIIEFGNIPDPVLLTCFEYTQVSEILNNKIQLMLNNYEMQQVLINNIIDDLVKNKTKLAIWGTGNFARNLMENTNLKKSNIKYFLDNDKGMQNKIFCGYEVKIPSYLHEFDGEILILSMNTSKEIEKQIRDMGIKNKIISLFDITFKVGGR